MNSVPPSYSYTQHGRGIYAMFGTAFMAFLAVCFFLTRNLVFVICGVGLTLLVFSGVYAFVKDERWSINIEDGILRWDYARWPKSSGYIELSRVRAIVLDDCSHNLTFTFVDGGSQKVKLLGYGSRLRDFLTTHYPHIAVEYVEGT